VLILGAAAAILYEAAHRLFDPQPVQAIGLGITLAVLSSALNFGLAWSMLKKAREVHSMALEADARHLFTDVVTSAGVVAGLVGVMLTGWLWLDPVLAMLVALNIIREGWSLLRRSADGLLDQAVEPEMQQRIDAVLARFAQAPLRFDHLTTRRAGSRRFVDLHLHMPAEWSLAQAAGLRGEVERALMAAVPGLRATIQLLPLDVEAHVDDPKAPS
jgi:cation diffusion facilitator family transporter